jgi:glycosyltransferase involved in cell wall biosynthesis
MLDECLSSLIPFAECSNIQIYISDDGSTDETETIVNKFLKDFPFITYKKNDSNIGMYLNTYEVIKMSKTKYIWLMGDDDRVVKEDLSPILSSICDGFDFIILNSRSFDFSMLKVKKERIIECESDRVYKPDCHEILLKDLRKWAYHGFMSSMIAKREVFLDGDRHYEDSSYLLYKNNWLPLIMFYSGIVGKKGIFLCKPLIENRSDNRHLKRNFWENSIIGRIKALESLQEFGYNIKYLKKSVGLNPLEIFYFGIYAKKTNNEIKLFTDFVKRGKLFGITFKTITLMLDILPEVIVSRILWWIVQINVNHSQLTP